MVFILRWKIRCKRGGDEKKRKWRREIGKLRFPFPKNLLFVPNSLYEKLHNERKSDKKRMRRGGWRGVELEGGIILFSFFFFYLGN